MWISKWMLLPRRKQKRLHILSLIFVLYKTIWWIWWVSLLSYCHHYQGCVRVLDDLNFQQISSMDFFKFWQFQNKIFSLFSLEFTKSHYKAGFHMSGMQKKVNFIQFPPSKSLILYIYPIKYKPHLYSWQYCFNKQDIACYNVESPFFSSAKLLNLVQGLCLPNSKIRDVPSYQICSFI